MVLSQDTGNQCIRLVAETESETQNGSKHEYDSQEETDADSLTVEPDMKPRVDIEYIRTKTMDTKKKTLQCPIYPKTYSRKDNLLRHLKKYHTESTASRMPPKKAKKSKPCPSESMVFYTPFTMIVSGATMSDKTEWVKRLLKHKDNMMSPVPKKVLFCCKYW